MLLTETVEMNGMTFTKNYSDSGLMIRKVGTEELYSEAYDVLAYTYEETDIPVPEASPPPRLFGWL